MTVGDGKTAGSPVRATDLADRIELNELLSRLGLWLDEKRYGEFDAIFSEDVVGEFPGGVRFQGLEELAVHARRNLSVFDAIQHVITNLLIDLDGDSASLRANLIATHIHAGGSLQDTFQVGCFYEFDAVRQADGWRFSSVVLNLVWAAGKAPAPAKD
jgi:hypothetical protein